MVQHLGLAAGTVDCDRAFYRIDQPAELDAVGDLLLHLFAERAGPLFRGAHFDHELRGEHGK
jgi:hypothetical protein